MREASLALSFDFVNLASGVIIAMLTAILRMKPWILGFYPMLLGVRGALKGILCGKLSTGLHTGLIKPCIKGNTRDYHVIIASVLILSLFFSTLMLLFAIVYFHRISLFEAFNIIFFSCLTSTFIGVLISSTLAFQAFKHNIDPDIILYPASSSIGDVLVSSTLALSIILLIRRGAMAMSIIILTYLTFILILFFKFYRFPAFKKTICEGFSSVVLALIFEYAAGIILAVVEENVGWSKGMLFIYPAFICALGDVCSMIGSKTTTYLHLYGEPSLKFGRLVRDIFHVIANVLLMNIVFTLLLAFGAYMMDGNMINYLVVSLANVISIMILVPLTLNIATITFRRGLDPDNYVNPLLSSLADLVGTIFLGFLFTFLS